MWEYEHTHVRTYARHHLDTAVGDMRIASLSEVPLMSFSIPAADLDFDGIHQVTQRGRDVMGEFSRALRWRSRGGNEARKASRGESPGARDT